LNIDELATSWEGAYYYQVKLAQTLALKSSLKVLQEDNVYIDYIRFIIDLKNPNNLEQLKINSERDINRYEIFPYQ